MVPRKLLSIAVFVAVLLVGVSAFAQTTGTLTGTVTTGGSPLPGATVSISSPALLGVRTTVTGVNGDYVFPAIAPGKYSVTFELEGMQKVTKHADVRLSETARADADLGVSKVAEAITVTATAPSVLETTQVSTSLTREQVEALPIGRTIAQRIQLAPGVNNAGPNNQTVINGAPSFDNLYLINGVVVNDSIRGQPENLFIEDAVQETTLLTGGVSAEYGRFTGGVVNTITKSGGNEFSGSFRDNLTNPKWSALSAYKDPVTGAAQPKPVDVLSQQYEATLGGYLLRDRLWFFGAGRKFNQTQSNTTSRTSIPYTNSLNNKRYEAKLTGQITSKHSLTGAYTHNNTVESANRFGNVVDLRSLTARELPNWLESFNYNGVITNSLLVEGLYSRRYFAFVGGGGPKDDLINGTLLRDNTTSQRMWSPTFCACDPKTRNNKDYLAKLNYFLTTKSMGSHNIVGGYDDFHELRHENNYQSGSNFRLWGDFSDPAADGTVYFHANPATGFVTVNPLAQLSQTSDVNTRSFFVNDKWDFSNHFSFNVGVRYDKDNARDQSHNSVATSSAYSPRLGIIYDIMGNGKDRISANYARYVSHIDSGVADSVSLGGNPGSIYFNYRGPEINPLSKGTSGTVVGTPVPTAQVIQMMFDWFNSVGGVNGYKSIDSIFVPGLTSKIVPEGLESPFMDELSFGYGHQIGSAGYVRADLIHRTWKNFYAQYLQSSFPKGTSASGSTVDVSLIGNADEPFKRNYNAAQIQAAYRLFSRINLGGNYTWSKLRGNVEGESFNNATIFAGSPGSTSLQYPEYFNFDRNNPVGYLAADIRHRGTLYGNIDLPVVWGSLNLGAIERFHSGSPYSAFAAIDFRAGTGATNAPGGVVNPGYATPPSSSNYYFSDRGEFRLPTVFATDLTATYNLPTFGRVNVFLRGDVVNVFNEQKPEYVSTPVGNVINTSVFTRRQRAKVLDPRTTDPTKLPNLVPFNPVTTPNPTQFIPGVSPLDGTANYNYQLDPNFGKPINPDAFGNASSLNPNQVPRTYRFAVGVRF